MNEMSEEGFVFLFHSLHLHINVALIFQTDSRIGWFSDIGKWKEFLFQHHGATQCCSDSLMYGI